jgi:hypothetical protein
MARRAYCRRQLLANAAIVPALNVVSYSTISRLEG